MEKESITLALPIELLMLARKVALSQNVTVFALLEKSIEESADWFEEILGDPLCMDLMDESKIDPPILGAVHFFRSAGYATYTSSDGTTDLTEPRVGLLLEHKHLDDLKGFLNAHLLGDDDDPTPLGTADDLTYTKITSSYFGQSILIEGDLLLCFGAA